MVRGYRTSILSSNLPAAGDLALLAAFALVTFVLGGLFFRHTKRASRMSFRGRLLLAAG